MKRTMIIMSIFFAVLAGLVVYSIFDGYNITDNAFSAGILLWVFTTTVRNEINIARIEDEIKELKGREEK